LKFHKAPYASWIVVTSYFVPELPLKVERIPFATDLTAHLSFLQGQRAHGLTPLTGRGSG